MIQKAFRLFPAFLAAALSSLLLQPAARSAQNNGTTIGTPGGPTQYYYFENNLLLPDDLIIDGPVVIVAKQDVNAQNHTITVTEKGSLTMYLNSNLNMHGNGSMNNLGKASNMVIYGTKTSGQQDFVISGGGTFTGVIYAPYAHIMHNGGGNGDGVIGSIVAKKYTKNGSPGGFHFDEALANLTEGEGGAGAFSMTKYVIAESPNAVVQDAGWLAQLLGGNKDQTYEEFMDSFFE